MNEAQLLYDRWSDDERVEIGSAHRPIDAVHGDDESRPGVDNPLDRTLRVGVELSLAKCAPSLSTADAILSPNAFAVSSVSTMCR